MKSERESQANNGAHKECAEYQFFLKLYLNRGTRHKVECDTNKSNATKQMCPDVASLRMDTEYWFEACAERG